MKVKELIEELKKLSQDSTVKVSVWYSIGSHEDDTHCNINSVKEMDKRVTIFLD